ncbi:MAG: endo-1,4-beta-xylanase [Prevotella sp.]|nr:endo-1,4-beta-xylanase [Prevotella sp.]
MRKVLILSTMMLAAAATVHAQLSSNPDKFLGNITTGWTNMDYDGFKYSDYWNQVTPENATKWECVEGTRGTYSWWNADVAANYARQHGMPFKFHTLVWGSQYPGWMNNLSKDEQLKAVVKWMDAVKAHYPNLEMIDVVNEAIPGHAPAPFKDALGGDGKTGYDWIVRAFEMAAERWPDAILIYNDYNTFQYNTDQFIDLVRTIRDAGAPVDAYGCQSHELGGMKAADFGASMKRIHDELQMPMYITEYDIGDSNDGNQNWNYQQHIPLMWEADYCAGVTLWGWIYGQTWTNDGKGYSGLIKDKKERSAMTWLRQYMQTDKARQAKSPFPGMKKEASLYIKPSTISAKAGETVTIDVTARMKTKTLASIDLYVDGQLYQTFTQQPYSTEYTPAEAGRHTLKAVATCTDGTQYERTGGFTVTAQLETDRSFTSLAAIGSTPFAIVNEADSKALFGSSEQHLGYADYQTAFTPEVSGYLFKLEKTSGGYLLRLITPKGQEYSVWGGWAPGYLNSQPVSGNCCFILGLNNQNGQDIENGAVWDIQHVAGKGFSLKNVGTGKYLKDNDTAKYDEPTYFNFCTLKTVSTGIGEKTMAASENTKASGIYDMQGRRISLTTSGSPLVTLKKGIYIVDGRKVCVK